MDPLGMEIIYFTVFINYEEAGDSPLFDPTWSSIVWEIHHPPLFFENSVIFFNKNP